MQKIRTLLFLSAPKPSNSRLFLCQEKGTKQRIRIVGAKAKKKKREREKRKKRFLKGDHEVIERKKKRK